MATLEVTLWGVKQEVVLTPEHSEEFILRVADYLNDKMKKVDDGKELNTSRIALRAAYIIAAEHLLTQNGVRQMAVTMDEIEKELGSLLLQTAS